jgi:hypothetical protein
MSPKRLVYYFLILFLSGCASTSLDMRATASSIIATNFNTSLNANIVSALKSMPLKLKVQVNEGSRIETSAKKYEGEEHGFWWWKHRWQEKTHFTIIIRSHGVIRTDGASSDSIIEVYAQTYHRKNSNFNWEELDTDKNDTRAVQVLNIILSQLENNNVS